MTWVRIWTRFRTRGSIGRGRSYFGSAKGDAKADTGTGTNAGSGANAGANINDKASVFFRPFTRRLLALATWLPVVIWFNSHVAEVTRIEGPSMYPFLNSRFNETLQRDWVLNLKLYSQRGLERGMVVFLRSPVHPEVISVKRVIGLEGDVVHTRQPYPTAYVRVPAGHVWVEGDAGVGRSLDSNTYGPVSVGLITGRLTHILLPLEKAGRVRWWEYPVEARMAIAS